MSDYATEPVTPESAAGLAGIGDESPAAEPEWRPSREEWENLQGGLSSITQHFSAQQAAAQEQQSLAQQEAYRAALEDAFDPYSENFDPERAMQMIAELVQAQTAPLAQALDEREYADALADAEDRATDILEELEVPEELQQEVVDRASELINERAIWQVLGPHGITVAQLQAAG